MFQLIDQHLRFHTYLFYARHPSRGARRSQGKFPIQLRLLGFFTVDGKSRNSPFLRLVDKENPLFTEFLAPSHCGWLWDYWTLLNHQLGITSSDAPLAVPGCSEVDSVDSTGRPFQPHVDLQSFPSARLVFGLSLWIPEKKSSKKWPPK